MSPRLTLIAVAIGIILAGALGLYWKGRHEGAALERPKIAAAEARAAVADLNSEGARQTAQRVDVVVRQREAAATTVSQLTAKALISEDAHAPLAADRAARLHDADHGLCFTAPDLLGCAPARDAR
jgi:hypothetical protein